MFHIAHPAVAKDIDEAVIDCSAPFAISSQDGAWLGVHVALLSTCRARVEAFVEWAWDYFQKKPGSQILDRTIEARINWNDDAHPSTLHHAEATTTNKTFVPELLIARRKEHAEDFRRGRAVIVDQVIATLHHLFCDLPRHTFCLRVRGISGIKAIHALSIHRVHVRNFLLKRRNIDQWKNDRGNFLPRLLIS